MIGKILIAIGIIILIITYAPTIIQNIEIGYNGSIKIENGTNNTTQVNVNTGWTFHPKTNPESDKNDYAGRQNR